MDYNQAIERIGEVIDAAGVAVIVIGMLISAGAAAARPPAASARRHRFADIRDTRKCRATSRSLAPASIKSAAAKRTCSRRARSAASSPPPSGYLMLPA